MLQRSHIASCRLNLQHYLWKAAIGYNVHPSIPISSGTMVADIAAGTGMWLIEMAQSHPTVLFEGFDNNLVISLLTSTWMPERQKPF
jgi:ubiquinone/menaquinone biosynthesis C-methylase UbiE